MSHLNERVQEHKIALKHGRRENGKWFNFRGETSPHIAGGKKQDEVGTRFAPNDISPRRGERAAKSSLERSPPPRLLFRSRKGDAAYIVLPFLKNLSLPTFLLLSILCCHQKSCFLTENDVKMDYI